jgi:HK97 family phage major capsid protein
MKLTNKNMGSVMSAALIGSAQVRSVTVDQINNNGGAPLRRHTEVRNIDESARTVEVAFSSETPVARWFGEEILDHGPGAMITDRLSAGAAVLWNHNNDIQIGVVESHRIDGDRVGRAMLRFGRSARAEEIWQDVVGGIIRHISFGYFVRAIKTTEVEGEPDQVLITSFEPFEISFVSIPADPSVGVGRAADGEPPEEAAGERANTALETDDISSPQSEGSGPMIRILRNANGDLVRAEVDASGNITKEIEVLERAAETQELVNRGTVAEQTRAAEILAIADEYDVTALASSHIRDGSTVEVFTRAVLAEVAGGGSDGEGEPTPSTRGGVGSVPGRVRPAGNAGDRALDDNAGTIGMTSNEADRFSFIRAARALLNPSDRNAQSEAAFEFDASSAAQQSMGRSSEGITVPVEVLTRTLNTAATGAGAGDTGGYLIDTTLATQSFIQMLRNRAILLQYGTPMGGLVGNLDIPGQASSGNVFIVGEDSDVGEGGYEAGLVSMSPRTIGVFGRVTRKMMQQSSMDVEFQFRSSLASDMALGLDYYGWYGDGVGNNPLGVLNTSGINAVEFVGVQPTYQEIIQMESEVAVDNALTDNVRYVANSKFRGHCKSTEKFTGSNGMPIWEAGNTVNGTDTQITNQFADGDSLFGNLSDVLIGLWGALDILVDPYTQSLSGTRRIVMHQDFDVATRRKASFCLGRKAAA